MFMARIKKIIDKLSNKKQIIEKSSKKVIPKNDIKNESVELSIDELNTAINDLIPSADMLNSYNRITQKQVGIKLDDLINNKIKERASTIKPKISNSYYDDILPEPIKAPISERRDDQVIEDGIYKPKPRKKSKDSLTGIKVKPGSFNSSLYTQFIGDIDFQSSGRSSRFNPITDIAIAKEFLNSVLDQKEIVLGKSLIYKLKRIKDPIADFILDLHYNQEVLNIDYSYIDASSEEGNITFMPMKKK